MLSGPSSRRSRLTTRSTPSPITRSQTRRNGASARPTRCAATAATGRKTHFTSTTVLRVEHGNIVEELRLDYCVTALSQLDLIPLVSPIEGRSQLAGLRLPT